MAAYYCDLANNITPPSSPFTVPCTFNGSTPVAVDSSLDELLPPIRSEPVDCSSDVGVWGRRRAACVGYGQSILQGLKSQGFNANCDPVTSGQLRALRRHGCQLLERQFGLSRVQQPICASSSAVTMSS